MKKITFFFSSIIFLIILYFISIYVIVKNINVDEIISNLKDDININLVQDKEVSIKIFPVIEINSYITEIYNDNIIANNISLIFSQPHYISSGNLRIKINKLFINNLVLDDIYIQGKIEYIKNYLKDFNSIHNIFNGKYEINSKLSLQSTDEEKFLISFLKIFFEKLENDRDYKFALSTLIDILANNKSYLKGSIIKENNTLKTKNIFIENESNKIILSGSYNLLKDDLKFDLDLEQKGEIFISAKILGKIDSPKIEIDRQSKFFKVLNNNNNNNNIIEESVIQFLNKFLAIND